MGKKICIKDNQGFMLPFVLILILMTMTFCLVYYQTKVNRLNKYVEYQKECTKKRKEIERVYQFFLGEEDHDIYYDLHYICTYSTNHHFVIYEQDEIYCIRRCVHE